jgi:PAS domain S-box-containing protein
VAQSRRGTLRETDAEPSTPGEDSRLAVQVAVARVLAEATTVEDSTRDVLGSIGGTLGWTLGALWELDEEAGLLRCRETWQRDGTEAESFELASRETTFEPGVGLPGRVWQDGSPAWIQDVVEDPNFPRAEAATRCGVHGGFAFPIRAGRGVIGVIEFFTREFAEPDRYLLDLMETIGYQLGQQIERSRAEEAVRDSEARKSAMLEASLDCIVSMDAQGCVVEFNAAAERTFGWTAAEVMGREMCDFIIPPALRDAHRAGLRRYLETGEGAVIGNRIEIAGMRRDGREFPVELTIVRAPLDGPPLFTGFIRDISERKRRQAFDRFMAEAGALLGASLDYESTLEGVAMMAVPGIADWCGIELLTEDGTLRRVAVAHSDPAMVDRVQELADRWPRRLSDSYGVGKVMRTGEPEFAPEILDSQMVEAAAGDAEHLAAMRELGARSTIIVPLQTVPGRIIGALTLVAAESGFQFDAVDVGLATELGRRCAVAVENARLYAERDRIARTLQESLLPPDLPEIPGVTIEARFRPAGEGIDMGGDFYDAFEIGAGSWAVTIGDVCGKGPDAAALTALVRYTLRAVTMHERRPEHVLELVNRAILRDRNDDRFCSAALAVIENRAEGVHVDLASAGHPLPLLLHPDGSVETIGARGHLLGLWPDFEAEPIALELAPGDTLILYTDGVTDARAPERILDTDDLAELVRSCAGAGAAVTAERIEQTVAGGLAGEPRDDIAVLVIEAQGLRTHAGAEDPDEFDGALRLSIPSSSQAPGRARRAVERLSGELDPNVLEQLKLLATELVTNSCRHAAAKGDPIAVVLALDDGVVRLSVTDTGPGFTAPEGEPDPDGESGRGLFIVDALADRWGVDSTDGTRVWLELAATPPPPRTAANDAAWGADRSGTAG